MKTILLLATLLGLAACSTAETLAVPKGPAFALNTGRWQPTPTDLLLPPPGKGE